jgi:excisionase family DNA binding protein
MKTLKMLPAEPARRALRGAAHLTRRAVHGDTASFSLIDAKAASRMLGVPHTWLLAQAREGRIPHHRLGHYVRFNPDDLKDWLAETRSMPTANGFRRR